MKSTLKIIAVVVIIISMVSCQKEAKPNYQYMPNMYAPVGYETYGEYEIFPEEQEAMLPVEGSIPRGWMPYEFENSNVGYQLAKDTLKNPLSITEENLKKGQELYGIYCAICHGGKGNGKGKLVEREKILGVPSYDDVGRAITEGSIYHVMYYGINSMGSYASQTSIEERWQIVQYVQKLKAELEGKPFHVVTPTSPDRYASDEVVFEHGVSEEDTLVAPNHNASHEESVNPDTH